MMNTLKIHKVFVIAALIVPICFVASLSIAQPAGYHPDAEKDHILNCLAPSGHHLYFTDETCPLGGESFKTLRLGTHSTFGRHLDWKPMSYLDFPAPVAVCPSNGFIVTKKSYRDQELENIAQVVNSEPYQTMYAEKHASYYLLAKLNQTLGADAENIWWQLLNATWEANGCGAIDKYHLYAAETIEAAKSQLAKTDASDNLRWVLNIIIPNMYRRIGEFEQSEKWLDDMGELKIEDEKTQSYFNLALALLREGNLQKNTGQIPIKAKNEQNQ